MNTYLFSIEMAFLTFPFIAFILAIPYMIYQYHKHGSIPFIRTLILYSFLLYMISIYFLVILPLPNIETVKELTTPYAQLIPFHFVIDAIDNLNTSEYGIHLLLNIIKSPEVYTNVFNLFMFLPFGIYLRYYFKCSLKKTIFFSFLLSLFFEVTQLSGLYFIYPRPYRLFDVDDLIINTLGGTLGYSIAPALTFFLPSRDKIDEQSEVSAENIRFFRRLAAFIIDAFIINILANILSSFIDIRTLSEYGWNYFLYFSLFMTIGHGQTIGKKIVHIKVITTTNKQQTWRCLLRYFLLFIILMQLPLYSLNILNYLILNTSELPIQIFAYVLVVLMFICYLVFGIQICIAVFKKDYHFLYEKISRTKNISTI